MRKFTTTNGHIIETTPRGHLVDMHIKTATGRTVATVVKTVDEASAMLAGLKAGA
ncbi:hypothetical protein [Streptomyces reniochalinae]|uniref:hypothetical protein n=1 Tax=Streptomyces reniochalinae TaxID=2250578 RepID=UPI0015F0D77C|nr:hypothetical protein [Streptomyces reniochalinae]